MEKSAALGKEIQCNQRWAPVSNHSKKALQAYFLPNENSIFFH